MKDFFSPGRFCRYFAYDLRGAWARYGLILLVLALTPVYIWVVWHFFETVITGTWTEPDTALRAGAATVAFLALMISAPVRIYGPLTEKREGTSWTLLPASIAEKTLSMVLVSGIVVPACFLVLFTGADALVCLLDKDAAGAWTLLPKIREAISEIKEYVRIDWFLAAITWTCSMALPFLTGAVWFRKGKVPKTFLVLFGLGMLNLMLGIQLGPGLSDILERKVQDIDPGTLELGLNLFIHLHNLIVGGLLCLLIGWRLRHIRH